MHQPDKDHVINLEVPIIWEIVLMPHQKKEKEFIDNMEGKWGLEDIITETTGTEVQINKEDQHFKPIPIEQEEMIKQILPLDHQHHQDHKLMQYTEHLPMQQ